VNDNPRLCFFDVDPVKFSGIMDELLKKGVVDMANYHDDEWIDVDDGMIDVSSYDEELEDRMDDAHEEYNDPDDYYNDSMDGDFDTAMRDAGFGTDEDYGYYGEDY
jgi:hypothetical protein